MTNVSISFRETSGLPVRGHIQDFIPSYGGSHLVFNYQEVTGTEGIISTGLGPGTYDIHFTSTDQNGRRVEFHILGVERTLHLERYRDVALATLTIGAVLLGQGVSLAVS